MRGADRSEDVATAAATALTAPDGEGTTLRITGPEALTFHQVADALSTVLGLQIGYVDVPDAAAHAAMVGSGLPDWQATNLVTLFTLIRAGQLATVADDYRDLTGGAPHAFADFARDHAALFMP